MNAPVREAISGLQQSLSTLQSAMLQSDLISSQAVLRTIRASSALENAQVAWGRFLNLPGRVSNSGGDSGTSDAGVGSDDGGSGARKRDVGGVGGEAKSKRLSPAAGKYYTHEELWGRDESRPRTSKEGKARWYDAVVQWEERRARLAEGGAENARIGRPFVV